VHFPGSENINSPNGLPFFKLVSHPALLAGGAFFSLKISPYFDPIILKQILANSSTL
jgi:hypothetical protein